MKNILHFLTWKFSLRAIGIVLFVYLLSRVDWNELVMVLREGNMGYFFVSLLFILPVLALRTQKWRELVRMVQEKPPFFALFRAYVKSFSLGQITPGKLGEFYRTQYLSDELSIPRSTSLWTVTLDKVSDFLGDVIFILFAIFALVFIFGTSVVFVGVSLFAGIGVLLLIVLIKGEYVKTLFHGMTRNFLPKRFRLKADEFGQSFFGERRKLSAAFIGKLFFYDIVTFQLQVFAFFFLALSLGLAIPFWYLYVYLPLLAIALGLPISIFGIGVREGGTIFLLSLVSINLEGALAFSLLAFLWSIFSALPGFVFLYMPLSKKQT